MARNKKQNLIIIEQGAFGVLTDSVKWAENLRDDFHIIHIGFKTADSISLPGVRKIMIPRYPGKLFRGIALMGSALWHLATKRGPAIVVFFPKCVYLKKLLPRRKMIMDVRTMEVNPDPEIRKCTDSEIRRAAQTFDIVTVISSAVKECVGRRDAKLVPLGSDIISSSPKNYSNGLRLLYVGTFTWRKLEDTLRGLKIFHDAHPDVPVTYTMIGDGLNNEREQLTILAEELGISDIVSLPGRIPHSNLKIYFDNSNIGVSYVPITDYYHGQPPTKTFEYIMSDLWCIATATTSNKDVITPHNGTLINDTPEGFAQGLERYLSQKDSVTADNFSGDLEKYKWHNIVKKNLYPILKDW